MTPFLVPLGDLLPPASLFLRPSSLHGQAHVARVMVHAFRLVEATGERDLAPALWAAVYIHDIARQHDGVCPHHGADAWARLDELPDVRELFARGGVKDTDYAAIETAVTAHCRGELPPGHPHGQLTALLKDADALDRVRIWDLDPCYLRHPAAQGRICRAVVQGDAPGGAGAGLLRAVVGGGGAHRPVFGVALDELLPGEEP